MYLQFSFMRSAGAACRPVGPIPPLVTQGSVAMWGGARTLSFLTIAFALLSAGCGGGSGDGGGVRPPPPTPDFTVAVSTSTLTIAQGDTSAPIVVSVTPLNGFSGNVSVTLPGVPAGITTNPVSPFTIPSSQTISVIVGAALDASVGQFSVSAQASSGTLSLPHHSTGCRHQPLTLQLRPHRFCRLVGSPSR